jgi:hypothetical protein
MRIFTEIGSVFVCLWLIIRVLVMLPFRRFDLANAKRRLVLDLERERIRTGGTPMPELLRRSLSSGMPMPRRPPWQPPKRS